MSNDVTIVNGNGWQQITPTGAGARTYRDLLAPCDLAAGGVELPSVTAVLDAAWPKDLTGWHDWLIGRHVEAEWERLRRMEGRDVGVELAQVPTVELAVASDRGTAVHDVAELEVQGEHADYAAAAGKGAGAWLPAVVAAFAALKLEPLAVEAVVFGPDAAGTLDGLAGRIRPGSRLLELDGWQVGDVVLWDNKSRSRGGGKLAMRDSEVAQLGGYLTALEDGYAIVDGKRVKLPAPDRLGVLTVGPVPYDTPDVDKLWRFTSVDPDTARAAWRLAVDLYRLLPQCAGVGHVGGGCTLVDDDAAAARRARLLELDVNEQAAVRAAWPGIPSLADRDAVQTVEGLELLDRVVDNVLDTDGNAAPAPDDPAACIAEGRDWLIERMRELAGGAYADRAIAAVRAAAAEHDLPPLKADPAELTVEHLERYRAAIAGVERAAVADRSYSGSLKVRRLICGPWAPAADTLTAPLRARLAELPVDLADTVRDRMQAAGIRPTSVLRWLDVPVVDRIITDERRRLEGRQLELELHVTAHTAGRVDRALKLLADNVTVAGEQLPNDKQLEQLAVVLDAIVAGVLVDDRADTAEPAPVAADDALEQLLAHERCAGKRDVLTLGRNAAAQLELEAPKSSDDVAGDALLAAFVWLELEQRPADADSAAA